MNQYANEEVAWQRLVDLQREMEYSRMIATRGLPRLAHLVRVLAERAWWIAGLAMGRAPRPHRAAVVRLAAPDEQLESRVA